MKIVWRDGGWVLLEAMAALLLLSVVLTAVLQSWLCVAGRVARAEDLLCNLALRQEADPTPAGWDWGPRVDEARWLGGPQLQLLTGGVAGEAEIRLGLWLEGWFQGELTIEEEASETEPAPGSGSAAVIVGDTFLWQSHPGEEVMLRVRTAEGGWGPPWRLVVPGSAAGVAAMPGQSCITVHVPAFVAAEARADSPDESVGSGGHGCLYIECSGSVVEVSMATCSQTFTAQGTRSIDLFF